MSEQTTTALREVLDDLAASRGYTLEGLIEESRRRGHDSTPAEILNGEGGSGTGIDDVLHLTGGERRRVAMAAASGWGKPNIPAGPPLAPGLGHYPARTPENAHLEAPACSVSHPAAGGPCPVPASMEVWSLAFCPGHGREAEAAALSEMHEAAYEHARNAVEAARPIWRRNAALLPLLRASVVEAQRNMEEYDLVHENAAADVYGSADDSHMDRETRVFSYRDLSSGTPPEWWRDERVSVCRLMREAYEDGLPALVRHLEPLREWATIQEVLAVRRELADGAERRGESERSA